MIKTINELTLAEFELYQEVLKNSKGKMTDVIDALDIFGYDVDDMDIKDLYDAQRCISLQSLQSKPVKKIYNINGRLFHATLNMSKFTAGQFIDLQTYISVDNKLENILSVILIPIEKNRGINMLKGKYKIPNYCDGYDGSEIQKFLYDNFTIGEANDLSTFFLKSSTELSRVMMDYLTKKKYKKKEKELKRKL